MKTILVSWLGDHDFSVKPSLNFDEKHSQGPVEKAVSSFAQQLNRVEFDEIVLLYSWGGFTYKTQSVSEEQAQREKVADYCEGLRTITSAQVGYRLNKVKNVTDYTEIYNVVSKELAELSGRHCGEKIQLVFHISSGTPTMQAIWLLLSKTEYPSTILIKTSREVGLELVDFPFDIAVRNQPYYTETPKFQNLKSESLSKIKWQSEEMREALSLAGNIARHDDMRVLIQGDTGVGKELFAELIHNNSKRAKGPFITVNCGAIPENLIEAELFGYKKGAFTGADRDKKGCFEQADGGTLFLDEIGELPLLQQVTILRLTDKHEQKVKPVGGEEEIKVDVRIIAATHRNLMSKVAEGEFREDLFYRLCDANLKIPPLRERVGDIDRLVDHFITKIHQSSDDNEGGAKFLSIEARQFLKAQQWPGNVRELETTISRAYKLYSQNSVISRNDVEKAMIASLAKVREDELMNQAFGDGFNVKLLELKVRAHYIVKAIKESGETNAAETARLLGFKEGTFVKQLRENSELRSCLERYPEGKRLLSKLKQP